MATPLPNLPTPAAYKDYFNSKINKGKPVAGGLGYSGSTVGDQWLAFYADKHGKDGSKFTLQAYAAAFLAAVTFALLNTDLQAGITGGTGAVGTLANNAIPQLPWAAGLANFLGALTSAATWLRVGEVILGVVLIAVGLAKMTNAVPIATSIAKAVK